MWGEGADGRRVELGRRGQRAEAACGTPETSVAGGYAVCTCAAVHNRTNILHRLGTSYATG